VEEDSWVARREPSTTRSACLLKHERTHENARVSRVVIILVNCSYSAHNYSTAQYQQICRHLAGVSNNENKTACTMHIAVLEIPYTKTIYLQQPPCCLDCLHEICTMHTYQDVHAPPRCVGETSGVEDFTNSFNGLSTYGTCCSISSLYPARHEASRSQKLQS
jgi:hypothetical protein